MMLRRSYWAAGALLALLALLTMVVPRWSAAEAGQNAEPRIGYASQRFDFFATGFDDEEAVGFWATRPDGSVTEQGAGQVVANDDGRADWFWVAPSDAPAGAWLIVAQGVDSGVLRTLRIEIVGPDGVLPPPVAAPPVAEQPAPEQPAPGYIDTPPGTFIPPGYTLDPREITVYAGQEVTFVGTGFAPGERVASWATGPDAAVIGGPAGSANNDGRVSVGIVLPERAVGGRWLFTLKGDVSQTPVTVVFDVIAVAPPEQSQATVAPNSGPVGTTFQFVATGFDDDERVGYWITDPDGRVYTGDGRADDAPDTTVDASDRGVVRVSWRVPSGPAGTWVLTLQGVESGIARGIPFDVQ